jgi:hypothetical protein
MTIKNGDIPAMPLPMGTETVARLRLSQAIKLKIKLTQGDY